MKDLMRRSVYQIGYIGHGNHRITEDGEYTYKYKVWASMMQRSYSQNFKSKHPTYLHCEVSEEWHNYQTFGEWFDNSYYEIEASRSMLDKDILQKNNKVYSPKTSIFVPEFINKLFPSNNSRRGKYPVGVSFNKKCQKFQARCNNSLSGKKEYIHLGSFTCPIEAFKVYKIYKENLIKEVANKYKGYIPDRLYSALIAYKVEIED